MTRTNMVMLGREEISEGQRMDLGIISVSEEEIIAFARTHDPLWLHVDREAAARGPWKGIIASGPMLFMEFHRRFWIPRFGGTVVAGMGIHNWDYFKPHYPDQEVRGLLQVERIKLRPDGRSAEVKWAYQFLDAAGETMQTADYTVLHTAGGFTWI